MKRLSWLALCLVLVFGLLFVIGVQAKKPKKGFSFCHYSESCASMV